MGGTHQFPTQLAFPDSYQREKLGENKDTEHGL